MAISAALAVLAPPSARLAVTPIVRRRPVPAHGPWPAEVHPVLQRVYAARGVLRPEDAELRLGGLLDPGGMGGLQAALDLLQRALCEQWRILVIGDFDADGATASAVAVRGLRLLGAKQVSYRVPNRFRHGYGVSARLIAELESPLPELLITVDTGIASHAGIEAARAAGMRALVTDHHLPGPSLPAADAIIDPNLPGDAFAGKHLAGVGVMFYLLLALRARLRTEGAFGGGGEPDLGRLLDLVALGTVADLVPLDRNNRILVAAGLRRLRAGEGQPGLCALAEVAGRRLDALDAGDLGFALGPRLNAAGRLDDMGLGVACLLCEDVSEARAMAVRLDALNRERRELQAQMVETAEARVAEWNRADPQALPAGLCLFDPDWHPGVVGLVASKVKERTHRPVIALAPAGDGSDALRGSARSIPGFHIRDALAAVDAACPGLIERFGGHAMAAGLSLPAAGFDALRQAFESHAAAAIDPALLRCECWSDGELAGGDMTRSLAEQLRAAGPWGQGFPEPHFDGTFNVVDWRVVGDRHLKLNLRVDDGEERFDAIHFGGWQGRPPPPRLHAVYALEPDDWRDCGGVQMRLQQLIAG